MQQPRIRRPVVLCFGLSGMLMLATLGVGCQQQEGPPLVAQETPDATFPVTSTAQSEEQNSSADNTSPPPQSEPTQEPKPPAVEVTEETEEAGAADPPGEQLVEEIWESIFLRGAKVGYTHSTVKQLGQGDDATREFEQEMVTELRRAGDTVDLEIKLACDETLDGKLISFNGSVLLGPTPQRFVGIVVGDELRLETTTAGRTATSSIAWDGTAGGFMAVEDSLRTAPLKPGEKRQFKVLAPPPLVQIADIELEAVDFEETELPGGTFNLLRVNQSIDFGAAQPIRSLMWTDEAGVVLKSEIESMGEVHFRTTPELARAANQVADVDLLSDQAISLEKPIPNAHRTKKARYRVTLAGDNPREIFHSGTGQSLESIDDRTAMLTVEALDPKSISPKGAEEESVADDLQPNQLIQSDDPRVMALADSVEVEGDNPVQLALALERMVHDSISQRNFTQAFASAAAVAETLEGDCTEHAVLLAAVARARGIPARVAVGLVYVGSLQGFGYHMWTEVFVNGHWLPLDATLGQGGIGAAHLKLADTNLTGQSAYLSLLPVAQVLGQLKIELIEAE